MARGYLITDLDDDDEWLPTHLSFFLSYQHKLEFHSFLYANYYLCDGSVYRHPEELQVYQTGL